MHSKIFNRVESTNLSVMDFKLFSFAGRFLWRRPEAFLEGNLWIVLKTSSGLKKIGF